MLVETLGIDPDRAETAIEHADELLTEEMRERIAHDEENARRRAEGLPTIEEEEAARIAAEEEAEIARLEAMVRAAREQQAAEAAAAEATETAEPPAPEADEAPVENGEG